MCKYELLKKIEIKRQQMIEFGLRHGLTANKTVKASQELDTLLNDYQHDKNRLPID